MKERRALLGRTGKGLVQAERCSAFHLKSNNSATILSGAVQKRVANHSPTRLSTSPDFNRVFNRCPAFTRFASRMISPVVASVVME